MPKHFIYLITILCLLASCSGSKKSSMGFKEMLSSYFDGNEYVAEENGEQNRTLFYATITENGVSETRFLTRNLITETVFKGSFNGTKIKWYDSENLFIEEYLGVANENFNGKRSYILNPETGEKKVINNISNEDQ
jgi:hypothetical protein